MTLQYLNDQKKQYNSGNLLIKIEMLVVSLLTFTFNVEKKYNRLAIQLPIIYKG